MVAQRFPGKNSSYKGALPNVLMRQAIERGAYGNRIDDEARLFYTAITRAERLLYLSGSAVQPGLKRAKKPSIFMASLNHSDMREDIELDSLADKTLEYVFT